MVHRWPQNQSMLLATALVALLAGSIQAQDETFPAVGTDGAWRVDVESRVNDVRVLPFLGRDALWLRNNTAALKAGVRLENGTIEFDVAPMDGADFFGVEFRRQRYGYMENVYFRPPKSGRADAMQYAPRLHGSSTWQIYPEFNRMVELPRNQWTHVRMEIQGPSLAVFVGDQSEPALRVDRMRGGYGEGAVTFWARVNFEPGRWAAAISNIEITPSSPGGAGTGPIVQPVDGTVLDWTVADPVPGFDGTALPALSGWRSATVEESGVVNLNREMGPLDRRQKWTAFARTTIDHAGGADPVLEIGYSDDVTVFVNGQPVYSGLNGWESRWERFLGSFKIGPERVHLQLQPGDNEIILAVADDLRFGWGVGARLQR